MNIYGELDPMPEHRTQFAFKGKREHISKVTCQIWHIKANILILK